MNEAETKPKPECRTCAHRGPVPGSAHICCRHPKAQLGANPLSSVMAIFASVHRCAPQINIEGAVALGVTANHHGIANGWFNWPDNFDPIWLRTCDGHTPEKPKEEKGDG